MKFLEDVSKVSPNKLVFVDESGLSIKMTRSFARARVGERVYGYIPGCWGENLTIIGAMKIDGTSALMSLPGAANGEAFKAYVEHILVPSLRVDDVVVMDNLSIHKVIGIREAIEGVGARILFLPPYHPDLNPIEKMWSKLKTIMRGLEARTFIALETALSNAINYIRPRDALAWFKHCGY